MTVLRGIPTSRAYWELKADQMMNRIFDPEAAIEVEVSDSLHTFEEPAASPRPPTEAAAGSATTQKPPAPSRPLTQRPALLVAMLAGVTLLSAGIAVLYLSLWSQTQTALRQERNLLLVERLRALGPANPPAAGPNDPAAMSNQPILQQQTLDPGVGQPQPLGADLPPPPPGEPWIQELAKLPQPTPQRPKVLTVPVSPALAAATPLPQLLGVVHAQASGGSAIFQIDSGSINVAIGEAIGGSGWRLRSTTADSVLIERNGDVRSLSISGGS